MMYAVSDTINWGWNYECERLYSISSFIDGMTYGLFDLLTI